MRLTKLKRCVVFSGGFLCVGWLVAAFPAAGVPSSRIAQSTGSPFSVVDRERRLLQSGLTAGSPVMIRIFKKESVLELWMQKEGRFELFRTYRICSWSGKLGPKQREGDRQAPEGFYSVDLHQLRLTGKNARSFYLDFPNALDRGLGRTGSAIMVHGRCTSIGCFAMTTPAMEEIYALVERALRDGQERIEVHAFPFHMTASNMSVHAKSEWHDFWQSLKQGYDLFEYTRIPPRITVCGKKYFVDSGDLSHTAMPLNDMTPIIDTPCDDEAVDSAPLSAQADTLPVKSKSVVATDLAGRNVRKAYAAARQARMASHARRTRTSEVIGKTRRQ